MIQIKHIYLSIFLLFGVLTSQVSYSQIEPNEIRKISDSIFNYHLNAREYLTGGVISVVNKDSVLFTKGYGLANREKKIEFNPYQTNVTIASVTKLITATAVLQLYERGKLDLSKPVKEYLPNLGYDNPYENKVLVQHLITHTSGLDDRSNFMEVLSREELPSLKEYAENNISDVVWPPGKYFNYSNYAYVLAAYLVETVSGMPFESYVEKNILLPLQMNESGFGYDAKLTDNLMERYRLRENNQNEIYTQKADTVFSTLIGVTGFKTTADDMSRFMMMYLNDGIYNGEQILKKKTINEAFSTHFSYSDKINRKQGLGWRIDTRNNIKMLYHYGDDTGVESALVLFPEKSIGVFTAFNNPVGYDVKVAVQNTILKLLYPKQKKQNITYKEQTPLEDIAGDFFYMNDSHTTFERIAYLLGDKKITVEANDDSTISIGQLKFKETDTPLLFHQTDGIGQVVFIKDSKGNISHYSYGTSTFRRITAWENPSLHLKILAGCSILLVVFLITVLIRWIISRFKKENNIQSSKAIKFLTINILIIVAFVIGLVIVINSLSSLSYQLPFQLKALFILPVLALLCLPITCFYVYQDFKTKKLPIWLRGFSAINVLAIVCCAVILSHYNFIGFNFV